MDGNGCGVLHPSSGLHPDSSVAKNSEAWLRQKRLSGWRNEKHCGANRPKFEHDHDYVHEYEGNPGILATRYFVQHHTPALARNPPSTGSVIPVT